ncbi:hypothetical protein QQG74_09300 [Micromonospora sp. FIMYZ51]|uniref:hypothetical protein n=1 Tax=Micromonospora sp. FIMYZ51 TaxID=3051832 RepID=UPI00311DE574
MTDVDTAAAIPTWHHPHFVSAEHTKYGINWRFREFTGNEPEPKIPAAVEEAFLAASEAHPWNSDTGRAVSAARRAAWDDERAANTLWQVARHNRRSTDLLKQIAPLVAAFQQAKKAAVDTYEELRGTPDGFWQAKLLTLAEHRQVALEAARQVDRHADDLCRVTDGLPERVLESLPVLSDLAKTAGLDLGDWWPQESYGYGDGPEVGLLKKLFAEQDERISEVARLIDTR